MARRTCCVIGGGPAGMVLALLLARSGVEVTVLEKHGDFLRDFRGDTVHPTTLALLDELGLKEKFDALPQRRVQQVRLPVGTDGEFVTLGDFTKLRTAYNYIAMVPQWDFLDLLAAEARSEPGFTLRMNTEATGFIRERGRINGVRYRTADGEEGELRSHLTVACDGRDSLARTLPELGLRTFSTPLDVWWFRLPRTPDDPPGIMAGMNQGRFVLMIDRGDYYQAAGIIAKGTDAASRSRPVTELNEHLAEMMPFLAGRPLLGGWDEVKLLDVKLDRLRRWHVPGLLVIGDAAHAMSPVGGVGINLAVQDAVAAARILVDAFHDDAPAGQRFAGVHRGHVAAIQRRRWSTTVLVQGFQRMIHERVVRPALAGNFALRAAARTPLPLRVAERVPWVRGVPPYLLAFGTRREHPPKAALRG